MLRAWMTSLTISPSHAERLVGDASHALYSFTIRTGARLLVEGRISVALGAAA